MSQQAAKQKLVRDGKRKISVSPPSVRARVDGDATVSGRTVRLPVVFSLYDDASIARLLRVYRGTNLKKNGADSSAFLTMPLH